MTFSGAYTAIVTPFRADGALDYPALERLLETQISGGISGVVVCGTTGERATLTETEYREFAAAVPGIVKGRMALLLGTGSNATAQSLEYQAMAADLGYQATLSVCPYYNKPSQEGLFRHFSTLADAAKIPIMLYNVPGRTGVNMEAATTIRLARHPNIAAIKEASANLDQMSDIIAGAPDFPLLAGDDSLALPIMAIGGCGVVSVASNQIPGVMSQLCAAVLRGDMAEARRLHIRYLPLFKLNFIESNPVPAKYLLSLMGLMSEHVRLPLVSLREESKARLQPLVEALGLAPV